jgi:hypothetical protein
MHKKMKVTVIAGIFKQYGDDLLNQPNITTRDVRIDVDLNSIIISKSFRLPMTIGRRDVSIMQCTSVKLDFSSASKKGTRIGNLSFSTQFVIRNDHGKFSVYSKKSEHRAEMHEGFEEEENLQKFLRAVYKHLSGRHYSDKEHNAMINLTQEEYDRGEDGPRYLENLFKIKAAFFFPETK